jgi:hypothetical protein
MKRKRLSPKKGRLSPQSISGNEFSSSNKKSSTFKKTHDSQLLGDQFIHLIGTTWEEYVNRNPLSFISRIKNSLEIIVPSVTISNTNQELNLRKDITYDIINHIGCLKPELLHDIHAVFRNHALTSTPEENFIPHLTGGLTKSRKIIWTRGINLLTFTFDYLMEKIFPYYDDPFKIIAEHFCDGNGNDFTPKQLRKNHSKKVQKDSKKDMICEAFLPIIEKGDA